MADQLSVHRIPGRNKTAIPFVLVVQSNRFRASVRRVVVPLVAAEEFRSVDSDIGPHFVVEGRNVVLDPLQITNIPLELLGPPVTSLVDDEARVVNAMDVLLSRAWR